jgi:hypothetical protein
MYRSNSSIACCNASSTASGVSPVTCGRIKFSTFFRFRCSSCFARSSALRCPLMLLS